MICVCRRRRRKVEVLRCQNRKYLLGQLNRHVRCVFILAETAQPGLYFLPARAIVAAVRCFDKRDVIGEENTKRLAHVSILTIPTTYEVH